MRKWSERCTITLKIHYSEGICSPNLWVMIPTGTLLCSEFKLHVSSAFTQRVSVTAVNLYKLPLALSWFKHRRGHKTDENLHPLWGPWTPIRRTNERVAQNYELITPTTDPNMLHFHPKKHRTENILKYIKISGESRGTNQHRVITGATQLAHKTCQWP